MAWYEEAIFYHIYPLGLLGAPKRNTYKLSDHRLNDLYPWIDHIAATGFNALYIGPLFESVGHGYETSDYYRLDSRLGDNEDLKRFVSYCHEKGIRVIFDAVFNHTGRDFFAFQDIKANRENSPYLYWYVNVDLNGNNNHNDGFSYEAWGGYDILPKLNLYNDEVKNYLYDVVRFWVNEFDIDGLRLDAADVLNFDFLKGLRNLSNEVKEDFWLMGEVLHGEYSRWVNDEMLHSVTSYGLYKGFYSGHNDHNYFEIAHSVNRLLQNNLKYLYNFLDNHDVERISSILKNKADYFPVNVLLFTLPGIPSIYYGSEFDIEGKKQRYSDASLRPALDLNEFKDQENECYKLIKALCKIRNQEKALSYGDYRELSLTTTQYAFARGDVIIAVNNSDDEAYFDLMMGVDYKGCLSGKKVQTADGHLRFSIPGHSGEIWVPEGADRTDYEPVRIIIQQEKKEKDDFRPQKASPDKPYEEMSIEELQAEILSKMAANGPLNDRMINDVRENVYRDSLLNWVRSFR